MDPVTLFFFVRQASPGISDSSELVSPKAGVLFYLLFSGEAALAGGPTPFFRPFSGEKVFVGVEASRIMLSSCQRIVRRSCGRYRSKSNTTIRSPVTKPQKAPLPSGRGAHIYALKVVSRCKPGSRHRRTARGRSRSPKRWTPRRSMGQPSRPVRPNAQLVCGRR